MGVRHAPNPVIDAERLFEGFEDLMPFRVQDILLVSSLYDSFILREDGRLNELLIGESLELNQQIPGITHVSSGAEALALARSQLRFNLIVTNLEVGDMDAAQLAREVKNAGLDVPVVVLAYDYREVKNFVARNPVIDIDRIFLWQGNVRILISIVKYVEDERNVFHDTKTMGVPVLLVVEDDIRYSSSFLPVIYTELITQSRSLISEGINVAHKLVRMRARPKILLCSNYEDAARQVMKYGEYLLGVVSDVEFPRGGELLPDAGFQLARMVRGMVPDIPIVLQSSRTEFMERAQTEGFSFLRKHSPTLLGDLRQFLVEQFGFGDFVFRLPDHTEVARARDLNALETLLHEVPAESIAYHGQRNHFSHWLMARTEFALAQKLRPRKVSDFATYDDLRRDLIESIAEYRSERSQVLIGDFNSATFKPAEAFFLRIGGGSLGGKARGLAFVRHLQHTHRVVRRFAGVQVAVPPTPTMPRDQLREEINRVPAPTSSGNAKEYVRATPYRLEEEKMAVILQQVVGAIHGQRFSPDFSGVVRSRNFSPVPPMSFADGIAAVALGLGREVVGGGKCLTFCPLYPRNIVQFSSVEDILANSQSEFWALELDHKARDEDPVADLREARFGLDTAERDGTLHSLGSTYSDDNHAVYDGLGRLGIRVVSFAPILKHEVFPLASSLEQLMRIGEDALGRPVEIEFAVRLTHLPDQAADFGFLQIRPLALSHEGEEFRMEDVDPARLNIFHSE